VNPLDVPYQIEHDPGCQERTGQYETCHNEHTDQEQETIPSSPSHGVHPDMKKPLPEHPLQ
jgi:hypothetical protein